MLDFDLLDFGLDEDFEPFDLAAIYDIVAGALVSRAVYESAYFGAPHLSGVLSALGEKIRHGCRALFAVGHFRKRGA